jgi:hypothetical protein
MKKNPFRRLPVLLKITFKKWNAHHSFHEGAVTAYNAMRIKDSLQAAIPGEV